VTRFIGSSGYFESPNRDHNITTESLAWFVTTTATTTTIIIIMIMLSRFTQAEMMVDKPSEPRAI
jgi:hypothetical protein